MHSPACETWRVHLRRHLVALGGALPTLEEFVADVIHSWETEQLIADPEFDVEFARLTAEQREAMDTARRISDPWERIEGIPASPRTDL